MTLREYLARPAFQHKLEQLATRASAPQDEALDAIYDVVAKMLGQGEKFDDAFPNENALLGYIRKVAFRALWRKPQRRKEVPLAVEQADERTPEILLVRALERMSLARLTAQSLELGHLSPTFARDVELLFRCLLASPEQFVKRRQSGPKKGSLAIDVVGLSKEMGWKRTKTYDRLSSLQGALEIMLSSEAGESRW